MKKLRRIIGLLLATVMVLTMSTVTFVTNSETIFAASTDYTITVNNATSGKEYALYKIFNLTYDEDNETYAYTITDDWIAFFTTGAGKDYVVVTKVNGVYYVTWDEDNQSTTTSNTQTFGQLAAAYADTNKISADATETASSTTVTFSGLDMGYYLVTSEVGTLVELNTVTKSVTIVDKNAKPTIEKKVSSDETNYSDTSTAGFTDTVYYKITITGIDEITDLILHDYLPTGFELDKSSISVKLYDCNGNSASLEVDTEYVFSTTSTCNDNCSFEIDFAKLFTDTTYNNYNTYVTSQSDSAASYIVVTYSVTVKDTANTSNDTTTTNINYAWVSHSETSSTKETTITTIYDFYVYKVDDESNPLEGAVFVLYKDDDGTTKYATFDQDGNLTGWVTKDNMTSNCYITSGNSGLIHLDGLDVGTYYLEETTAPDGYALLSGAITVAIASGGTVSMTSNGSTSTADTSIVPGAYTVPVENSTNSAMPTTGGIGTTIFYIIGCILVLGAAILLVTRVRMSKTAK